MPPSFPLWKVLLGGNFLRIRGVLPLSGKNPPNSIWRAPYVIANKSYRHQSSSSSPSSSSSSPSSSSSSPSSSSSSIYLRSPRARIVDPIGEKWPSYLRWPVSHSLSKGMLLRSYKILISLNNFEKWLNSHHSISKIKSKFFHHWRWQLSSMGSLVEFLKGGRHIQRGESSVTTNKDTEWLGSQRR